MSAIMLTTPGVCRRRLVLVDIENVAGGEIKMAQQVHNVQRTLTDAAFFDSEVDHVVVASGRASAEVAGFAWSGKRRFLFRPGIDGADLALLTILETERIAERFSDVLLVSGDAIFTDAVAKLATQGVCVTVASRPESFSRRLRMAASRDIELAYLTDPILEAA